MQSFPSSILPLFPELIVQDSAKVFNVGSEQYQEFWRTRFTFGTHDVIKSKITKYLLKLPKDADMVQIVNPRITINDQVLNKLRDACEFRPPLAKRLFTREWTGLPECLVKDWTPYHNPKSKILYSIIKDCMRSLRKVDAVVVNLSVIVRAQAAIIPFGSTFDEFSGSILRNITGAATHQADRIDIVSGQYSEDKIPHPFIQKVERIWLLD